MNHPRSAVMSWFIAASLTGAALRLYAQSPAPQSEDVLLLQSQSEADRKSSGCLACHTSTDNPTMHPSATVRLGCTDCHGGNSEVQIKEGTQPQSADYLQAKKQAHPPSRESQSSSNSVRAYTNSLRENWDF